MERGPNAIRDLLAHLPATAGRKDESGTEQVAVAELAPGDVLVIRPGTRIPVDDEVVPGHALVDRRLPVSRCRSRRPSAPGFCGHHEPDRRPRGRTLTVGRDTAFGKIIKAVERAEESQAPFQKTADRRAG